MATKTISLDAAHDLVTAALTANRTSLQNARSVAAGLVGAEADGIKSHGLSRVPSYAGQAESGKIDGFAVPQVNSTAAAALVIDAALGFAYPAIDLVVARLPALAQAHGIAVAAINRSNHCGVAGLHVERLARAG